MTKKATNVNAYIKDGKTFVAITLEDETVVFVNKGILEYALKNAKPVKAKENN